MEKFLTLTTSGLSIAGVFAVAASGLVLTYTTTGVFNFAHGAIGMLGAFAFWQLHVAWGVPTWLALLIVLVVLAPALGILVEAGIMRRLAGTSEATQIVVTVALLAAALGLGQWIWSPLAAHPIDRFWGGNKIAIGNVNVTWHALFSFGAAVAVAVGLRVLLYRTRAGITMRAAVDDRRLSLLNGARPDRASMLAWAIGCSLAALSGVLISPDQGLQHTTLTLLIVNAYAAAMLGRLRSLPLTFLGAVLLGLADAYGSGYIDKSNDYLGGLRPAIPIILLFIVLLVLPQSRIRGHSAVRSRERFPEWSWRGAVCGAALLVIGTAAVASLLTDGDARTLMQVFGIAIVALSLVPLVGYAGQISLCQMSFAGIGAVVFAHQGSGGSVLGLLVVAIVCGAVGALIALPALRLSGIYLALATGAFAVILDRWIFILPNFDLGPWKVKIFELGTVSVDRLSVPGVDPRSTRAEVVVVAALFALLALGVARLRSSRFGERLLALKDSPAACATLGINLTVTKLGVFSLSAAMAGIGGAVYGGAISSISPERFSFFESLPVLLLAVVGGLGTPAGALLGALTLSFIPILAGTAAWLANPSRILPGTIGLTLGRNPNGVAADLGERLAPLRRSRVAIAVLVVLLATLYLLAWFGTINGWIFGMASFLSPFLVARAVEGPAQGRLAYRDLDLELLGIERPYTDEDVKSLDRALALQQPGPVRGSW